MDSVPTAVAAPTAVQALPRPEPQEDSRPALSPKRQRPGQAKAGAGTEDER
jgi:hypothetical protein